MKKVSRLLVYLMLLCVLAVPASATDILPEENPEDGLSTVADTTESSQSDPSEGDQTPVHEHSWGDGEITSPATCTQPGVKTYTCDCLETKTEEIAASGHNYGEWQVNDNDHSRICVSCGNFESESHKWSSTVQKKPTCKEDGILEELCSGCGSKKIKTIEKLNIHTYDSACDSECNVCASKRVVEHDFEEVWVKDSTGHWYACTKCDEKIAFSKHNPGPESTEETAQLCTTCKYVIKPKKQHTHSFEKKWTMDEAGHWHACKTCDAEQEYAAHIYDDACDSKCDLCGYEKDSGHIYDDKWQTTTWEHWALCTVCGEESKHEKHTSTEEATETSAKLCDVCGYELEPIQIHSHNFEENWEWDTVNHWQICSCGEESVAMEHIWDDGREVKPDILEFSCTECGMTRMEKKESGFPWVILLVILALACIGGIVYLVILLKRGDFEDDEDQSDEIVDTSEIQAENPVTESSEQDREEPDPEEEMIDAFFASLDKE